MANRSNNTAGIAHAMSEVECLTSHMTGAGAADLVAVSGDVESADQTATGVFDLVFKHKYPQGLTPFSPGIVGTTTGLVAIYTAWDPAAGTATVKFSVGSVATNPATTDEIHFAFLVRNSGRNPDSV